MAVALDAVWVRVKGVCKQNGLLILSVMAVIIGCLLGFFLRSKQLSEQVSHRAQPSPILPNPLPDTCLPKPPPTNPTLVHLFTLPQSKKKQYCITPQTSHMSTVFPINSCGPQLFAVTNHSFQIGFYH